MGINVTIFHPMTLSFLFFVSKPVVYIKCILKRSKLPVYFLTIAGVVGACSSSDHLRWPLSPDVCTDQVLSNPDLHLRYCPLQFVDDVPPLPTTPSLDPHSVNLSAENSLDFRIYSAPSGDYGFSVFVKPAEETNSCILHYKSDDGSFEMKFTSTPTESVASIPGVVSCSFKPLPQGQWRKIGMSMDDSNAKINAFVDVEPFDDYKDDVQSAASIRVLPKFAVPGTLRVGGSFDGETYKGLVSCIGFVFHKNLDCSTDCYDSSTWSTGRLP